MDQSCQGAGEDKAPIVRRTAPAVAAAAGAVVLACAGVACGNSASPSGRSSQPASVAASPGASPIGRPSQPASVAASPVVGSSSPSAGTGNARDGGHGCSTQGVGGDSVPPICGSLAASSPGHGLQGFPTPSASPSRPTVSTASVGSVYPSASPSG